MRVASERAGGFEGIDGILATGSFGGGLFRICVLVSALYRKETATDRKGVEVDGILNIDTFGATTAELFGASALLIAS